MANVQPLGGGLSVAIRFVRQDIVNLLFEEHSETLYNIRTGFYNVSRSPLPRNVRDSNLVLLSASVGKGCSLVRTAPQDDTCYVAKADADGTVVQPNAQGNTQEAFDKWHHMVLRMETGVPDQVGPGAPGAVGPSRPGARLNAAPYTVVVNIFRRRLIRVCVGCKKVPLEELGPNDDPVAKLIARQRDIEATARLVVHYVLENLLERQVPREINLKTLTITASGKTRRKLQTVSRGNMATGALRAGGDLQVDLAFQPVDAYNEAQPKGAVFSRHLDKLFDKMPSTQGPNYQNLVPRQWAMDTVLEMRVLNRRPYNVRIHQDTLQFFIGRKHVATVPLKSTRISYLSLWRSGSFVITAVNNIADLERTLHVIVRATENRTEGGGAEGLSRMPERRASQMAARPAQRVGRKPSPQSILGPDQDVLPHLYVQSYGAHRGELYVHGARHVIPAIKVNLERLEAIAAKYYIANTYIGDRVEWPQQRALLPAEDEFDENVSRNEAQTFFYPNKYLPERGVAKLLEFLQGFDAYRGMSYDYTINHLRVQLNLRTVHGQLRPQGELARINHAIKNWVYRKRRTLGNKPLKKTARDLIKDLLTVYLKQHMSLNVQPGAPRPILTLNVHRIPDPRQRNSGNPPNPPPYPIDPNPVNIDGDDPHNLFANALLRQLNLETLVERDNDDHLRRGHRVLTTYYRDNVVPLNPQRHMYTQLDNDDTASVATGTTAVLQEAQRMIG